jgi:homoserine dehydrogenase
MADVNLTGDALEVVDDPDIDDHRRTDGRLSNRRAAGAAGAMANGKHVVTANKALIARHGNEIFAAAHAPA